MDQHVWDTSTELNWRVPLQSMRKQLLITWNLSGQSKSAKRTGLKMGPFYLDAGNSVFTNWDVLLISHGHADHVFSLGSFYLVEQSHTGRIYAAVHLHPKLDAYAKGLLALNGSGSFNRIELRPAPEEPEQIKIGKDHYELVTRKLTHRLPSIGYFVSKITYKIKPELLELKKSMTGPEFGAHMSSLRRKGEPINDQFSIPQFCFLTDTSIRGVLDNMDLIVKYPIIIVECTFFGAEELAHAAKKTHTHWTELKPLITGEGKDSLWVLIHSSTRYTTFEDVQAAIATNEGDCGCVPTNCLIWI